MTQILLVEDDLEICEILQFYLLKQSNYNVTVAHSSKEARMLTGLRNYDLILMDIMLPDQDGLSLCEELRKTMFCPIIFISCLSDDETVIRALNMGGDDYLIKPFAFEELLARIRVMMRRKPQFVTNQLKIADLTLDRDTRIVTRAGKEISLSSKEFMVLECLMRNQNIVMTRQQIEQNAWNYDYEGGSNVIDVYIRYLRKKIDAGYEKKLIHTVRGTGYVMREE